LGQNFGVKFYSTTSKDVLVVTNSREHAAVIKYTTTKT